MRTKSGTQQQENNSLTKASDSGESATRQPIRLSPILKGYPLNTNYLFVGLFPKDALH